MLYSRRVIMSLIGATTALHALPLRAGRLRIATDNLGVAIDGYDTTAYWQQSAARRGDAAFWVQWRDVPWHFTSQAAADHFAATPEALAPHFGGFCTRAMSFGKVVNGDPEVWRIYAGRLYLFAQPVGGEKFDAGQDAMIAAAQEHWNTLA